MNDIRKFMEENGNPTTTCADPESVNDNVPTLESMKECVSKFDELFKKLVKSKDNGRLLLAQYVAEHP